MALPLLLPLLAWLPPPPPGGPPAPPPRGPGPALAEPLPAPALAVLPPRPGPGGSELLTLRCLAPLTSAVAVYLFYRRPEPRGPRRNFRNSSSLVIEEEALPGLYSCAYLAHRSQGLAWSLESPPTPFSPPWGHLPPMHSGIPIEGPRAPSPSDNSTARTGCSPGPGCVAGDPDRSASCHWHPGMSPALVTAALGFLLPRGCC